jgi:hypothetical protein
MVVLTLAVGRGSYEEIIGRQTTERIKHGADRINWDFTPSSLGNVEHFRVMSALARS